MNFLIKSLSHRKTLKTKKKYWCHVFSIRFQVYFTIILYIIYLVGGGVIFITSFLERRWLLKYNTFLPACVLESGLHMSNDLIYYLSTCKQVSSVAWFISRQWKNKIITRHIVYIQYFHLNKVRNHVMNGILFLKE